MTRKAVVDGRADTATLATRGVDGLPGWVLPLLIAMAALALRLIVLAQLVDHPLLQPRGVLDDAVYVKLARRVAAGDLALAPDVYYLSPLYTYFLGFVFALTGGSIYSVRVVQVLLGAASVWFVIATARLWFGRSAGIVAGVLAACTGLFAFNEILILQSSLDCFLTALALFALARALQSATWPRFATAGLAAGLLALNRPNALLCVPAIAVVWLASRRSTAAPLQAVAFALATLLVLSPVALRNRVVGGEWVLITSHGGLNFYIGNGPDADGTWRPVPGITPSVEGQARDATRVAGAAMKRPVSASEASSYFYDAAWKWIRENPGAWAALLWRKFVLTFNAADVALNYSYTYYARDEHTILALMIVGPWLIVPLGLLGLVVGAPRDRRAAYVTWAAFVPVYAASLVAFFVSSRYRLALLVPLVMTSGAGVTWLWARARQRHARTAAVGVAALAALLVFANWPVSADNGRMNERMERIVWLIADGKVEQGRALLDDTLARHPQPSLLLYRVGLAFRDRGEPAIAVEYLQRALKAAPGQPFVELNLGQALLDAHRAGEAVPHLDAARRAGAEPETATYDLARAYQALGKLDEARNALASFQVTARMDGRALLDLGTAALDLREPELAARFLAAAVARAPGLAEAHQQFGVALALQHRFADAISQFRVAVQLDPPNSTTHYQLALACAQAGAFEEARREGEEALRLQPGYAEAQRLLEQLPKGR